MSLGPPCEVCENCNPIEATICAWCETLVPLSPGAVKPAPTVAAPRVNEASRSLRPRRRRWLLPVALLAVLAVLLGYLVLRGAASLPAAFFSEPAGTCFSQFTWRSELNSEPLRVVSCKSDAARIKLDRITTLTKARA